MSDLKDRPDAARHHHVMPAADGERLFLQQRPVGLPGLANLVAGGADVLEDIELEQRIAGRLCIGQGHVRLGTDAVRSALGAHGPCMDARRRARVAPGSPCRLASVAAARPSASGKRICCM